MREDKPTILQKVYPITAIETVMAWDYNPSAIERKVEETPLTEKEKEIIREHKF